MDREELQRRIDKKIADIAKIHKRIEKGEAAKSEAAFIKDKAPWYSRTPKDIKTMDDLVKARWDLVDSRYPENSIEKTKAWLEKDYQDGIKNCDAEIKRANGDLTDAENTLTKYKNAIAIEDSRAQQTRIKVILDFLDLGGEQVTRFMESEVLRYKSVLELDHEICDKHNSGWYRDHPEADERADYRAYREAKNSIHPGAIECYVRDSESHLDIDKLNKLLAKEKEAKYGDLINRITDVAGNIEDASDLRISPKGNIDGYIQGDKHRVHVETIGAGGYNVDTIVNVKRGQIFHYRTLVHIADPKK